MFLRLTRYEYEEPYHLHLLFEAASRHQSTSLEFYTSPSELKKIGERLVDFPRNNSDVFTFELGSEKREENWAYYFKLKFFVINAVGHSAIQIRTNNNEVLSHQRLSDFCIEAEPAQINRLGKLLLAYSKLNNTVLEWSGSDSKLI